MAALYITECSQLGWTSNGSQLVQAPYMPPVTEQRLVVTTASTQSSAWNTSTRLLMINTDSTCSLTFSTSTATLTATTASQRMGANETRFYMVNPGGSVAVISNS